MDKGKIFEADFKKSCLKYPNISIDRLYDPLGGYKGIRNICDFICYSYPNQYYLELKSHEGKSFPFSCLTEFQYIGLLKKSIIPGVRAGVLIKYSDYDKVYYINITSIENVKNKGKKSINIEKAKQVGIELGGKKLISHFNYDIELLLEIIGR